MWDAKEAGSRQRGCALADLFLLSVATPRRRNRRRLRADRDAGHDEHVAGATVGHLLDVNAGARCSGTPPQRRRQGRASRLQDQLPAELEQLMFFETASLMLAQASPYSQATNPAHDLIASASAAFLLASPPLVP